jgi:Zn-dependent alcohol dehydrogenase
MKQETLEEAAENYSKITLDKGGLMSDKQINGFIAGAKHQAEQIPSIIEQYLETAFISKEQGYKNPKDWFEQFKNK